MCELCDLKRDTDKKWNELEFRMGQYQVELNAGRNKQAKECRARAQELFDACFDNLDKHTSLVMAGEHEHEPMGLADLLGKNLN